MTLVLDRDKLDVKDKNRSNLFNWRGQFTPQFVEYLLQEFAPCSEVVLDPFCGSGTVLREAALFGLTAHGFEINPAAYAMSKFFSFSNMKEKKRQDLFDSFSAFVNDSMGAYRVAPVFIQSDDFRSRYKNLLGFSERLFSYVLDNNQKLLTLLMLFAIEDFANGTIEFAAHKALHHLQKNLLSLPYGESKINAELRDARSSHERLTSKVDLIITSPPYINVFNYHQNYRAILEIFGFDMLKVAESEMGSNRKNRGNRFKTVVQYCLDMELAVHSFAQCLKFNAHLIMVIGRESKVRGIPFFNSEIVEELITSIGSFNVKGKFERLFLNRFGEKIYEDILVFQRNGSNPELRAGKIIAVNHLKKSLSQASLDIRSDISMAIEESDHVIASPFLNRKEIFDV